MNIHENRLGGKLEHTKLVTEEKQIKSSWKWNYS